MRKHKRGFFGRGNSGASGTTTAIGPNSNSETFATLSATSLSVSDHGIGDFAQNWRVRNNAGSYPEVGVDIKNSESYYYSYTLTPGAGGGWSAPEVSASENLDVTNANDIKAHAIARNSKGYQAAAEIDVSDPGNKACLVGYENEAVANSNGVSATQSFDHAIGMTSVSSTARDTSGRAANSQASFVGDYYLDQEDASISKFNLQSDLSLEGMGYLYDGSGTSATDGNGKEAQTTFGSGSGNLIKDKQSSSITSSGVLANLDYQAEYMPVAYQAGTYDQKWTGTYSAFAKDGTTKSAFALMGTIPCHAEHLQGIQSALIDSSTVQATNDLNMIGVVNSNVIATNGVKKAQAQSTSHGVYSVDQSASIGKSNIVASQNLNGEGYLNDGSGTSVTDGNGKEAQTTFGSGSGNLIKDKQSSSITKLGVLASLEYETEYMPVAYQTATYDQKWTGTYSASAKDGTKKSALAQMGTLPCHAEHLQGTQSASIDSSTVQATNDLNLIGVVSSNVIATNGIKGAQAQSTSTGVYSVDQSASIGKSDIIASQSLNGVGYLSDGSGTSVTDGIGKEAQTKFGSGSGNLITDRQSSSITKSGVQASLQSQLGYMPVSFKQVHTTKSGVEPIAPPQRMERRSQL